MKILQKIIACFSFISILLFSNFIFAEVSAAQQDMLKKLPADQRESILQKIEKSNDLQSEIEEVFEKEKTLIEKPEKERRDPKELVCQDCIYGYDFFKYSPSTFIQTSSSPVPSDYVLGPGDKLTINYYGSQILTQENYIARNGDVFLPLIGPTNLAGMTFREASDFLKNKVQATLIGTDISISLSELRSISVYILGEAYKPGLYTMSALSSISNALFVSGGVNEQGSLRNIQIKRDNSTVGIYDFYDFLLKGKTDKEIKLRDGDIIFIPFISNKVKLGGAFKRSAIYEFIEGETIEDAIKLAGGFKSNVPPTAEIELSSLESESFNREIFYLSNSIENLKRELINEDSINITSSPAALSRTIELKGEFSKPGVYAFMPGERVMDVIRRAGGYTSEAYEEGAIFLRESVAVSQKEGFKRVADTLEQTIVNIITLGVLNVESEFTLAPLSSLITRLREEKPLGRMVVDVDLLSLKTNPIGNFKLQDKDVLFMPQRPSSVSIVGEVLNTSTQSFDPEKGTSDYIRLAGGLRDSADKSKIFVILPNGQSRLAKQSLFSNQDYILPGSTIVVSRESRPLDGINLAKIITPVLADLATSAAAIAAISND
ncbi:SLBB domain-containing protein [Gammaproteobacteria bacterium]|nr:SLBB domain-containing protein [Gammaproteobacteria bacterium]